jgi:hypothetical protein
MNRVSVLRWIIDVSSAAVLAVLTFVLPTVVGSLRDYAICAACGITVCAVLGLAAVATRPVHDRLGSFGSPTESSSG